ncbi:MAG TPA: hypothetical protein VMW69_11400, partial [Spirochaetia bacterium]|nr:hypothetical protein [Spirochaetia bacterium]
ISNPALPTLTGTIDTPGSARRLMLCGDYVFIADWDAGGLQIVDISDPNAPIAAGSYNTPGTANEVTVSGAFAYVADGVAGLQIIRLTP